MENCSFVKTANGIECSNCGTTRTHAWLKQVGFAGDPTTYHRFCTPDPPKQEGGCQGCGKSNPVVSLAKAVGNWVVAGMPIACAGLQVYRYETCFECDRFDEETAKCKECGCLVEYKVKMETEKCPIG